MGYPEAMTGNSGQKIRLIDGHRDVSDIPWKNHARFHGVCLKTLISGSQTGGRFSSHVVRIDPGCTLESHCHEAHLELHEILEGEGRGQLNREEFDCSPGDISLIPMGTLHSLEAGKSGMVLYAKFFPALN